MRQDFYVTNGPVHSTVLVGNTLYLGGAFNQIGPSTGGGVPIDSTSGIADSGFPRVTANGVPGTVYAAVPDGAGGWYIGGSFSSLGGVPRSNLAHVLSNDTVAPWDPGATSFVYCLALSGSTVYAGGSFTSIGGQARNRIAALDANSGAASGWNPNADSAVYCLAVGGSTVYAGGFFTGIGGKPASGIAGLDATTGLVATGWDWINASANAGVAALALNGSTLYAGGSFSVIGGQLRGTLAALNPTTGHATAWNPNVSGGPVLALAVAGNRVYAGGSFSTVGGHSRGRLAAIDATTGLDTGWNSLVNNPNAAVRALAVSGSMVYAGGDFTTVGGQTRNRIAALDAVTGLATTWNPNTNSSVFTLALNPGSVFAGGNFTSLGGLSRNNLAAVDVVTGIPTSWNPNANGTVFALAARGSTVYAGGGFTNVGGLTRNNAAAMDATSGLVNGWNPNANSSVLALAAAGTTIYAGGYFSQAISPSGFAIGGAARNLLAALDPTTGHATAWNPNLPVPISSDRIRTLAVSGARVYAGGQFSFIIGGRLRRNFAAFDASTALLAALHQDPDLEVLSLATSGPTVYVAGRFTSIGGLTRNHIAALDTTGIGTVLAWDPDANSDVLGLAVGGSSVYAGGYFTTIGGQPRNLIAELGAGSGAATTWNPDANDSVRSVVLGSSTVYAGGDFTALGNVASGVAAISAPCSVPGGIGNVSTTLTSPKFAACGDFDGDGRLDVAVAVANGAQVLRNTGGAPPFSSLAIIPTGGSGRGVATADLNDDGVLDLVVSTSTGLYVILGTNNNGVPSGSFGSPASIAVGGANPTGIAVADLNRDGINDLVVAVTGANKVAVLLGHGAIGIGDGTFGDPALYPAAGAPLHAPVTPVLADFNGDGILDLAVTNSGDTTASVMLGGLSGGVPNGTFGSATNLTVGAAPGPVVIGDLNEDGVVDLIVGLKGAVGVLLGNGTNGMGNGTFAPASVYALANTNASVLSLVVTDLDNDGRADIGAALDDGTMAYFYGDGVGTWGNGRILQGPAVSIGGNLSALVVDAFDATAGGPTPVVAQSDQSRLVSVTGACSGVVGRTLEVTSPNGGEVLNKDSDFTIQWTRGPLVTAVNVDFSRDDAVHWERLASNQTRSQFVWHVAPPGAVHARVRVVDANMFTLSDASNGSFTVGPLLAAPPAGFAARPSFSLAYPNPSPGRVRFELRLPAEALVTVEVFDLGGRRVKSLAHGLYAPGDHTLVWDGRTSAGSSAASGIYFVRLRVPGLEVVRRVVRIE